MQRRAFNLLPENLQTEHNDREYYVADDVLYEPEQSSFVSGYIGDFSVLTQEDLERTPAIRESTPERQKYQLSIGVAFLDPDSKTYLGGSFYPDLVQHIQANGGIVSDHNRLFNSGFYSWTPPISYDKHVNFSRYAWTGPGTADINGEYVTKEPAGSFTTLYEVQGGAPISHQVVLVNGLPAPMTAGTFAEDSSTPDRFIYRSNGTQWDLVQFFVEPCVFAADLSLYEDGDYIYSARTAGTAFNRPLLWIYREAAGRWIATPAVINPAPPDTPRLGMIWEDSTIAPSREFRVYTTSGWVPLSWTPSDGPSGTPTDGTAIYDIRDYFAITDPWSPDNWWRHFEDLSPLDRAFCSDESSHRQAIRPIVEFWGTIEGIFGDSKEERNDPPRYKVYAFQESSGEIKPLDATNFPGLDQAGESTIYVYKRGSGQDDAVLGFPVTFTDSGEFQFDLTLESAPFTINGSALKGYRFFRDSATGFIHSIWAKSLTLLQQTQTDGLFDLPRNLTSNADHRILTDPSRSKIVTHMISVLEAQEDFQGDKLGSNNFRYTDQDPNLGSTIIDPEGSLLRPMALLISRKIDLPETIRHMAKEYNRIMYKFITKMNLLWTQGAFNSPDDQLTISAVDAVNIILSDIFVGRSEDFPFYYSNMGTFIETRLVSGVPMVIDSNPKPIYIPASPARIGAAPAFVPARVTNADGKIMIRGHEGSHTLSFGDDRDEILLELEGRFFAAVPTHRRTESETFSTRFNGAAFHLPEYYGNYIPGTVGDPVQTVDKIVDDYTIFVPPSASYVVYSRAHNAYAFWDGITYLTQPILVDDIFFNRDTEEYYIFNGFYENEIPRYERDFAFDYDTQEYRKVIRREFERWALGLNADFTSNTQFNEDDRFTWNFRSAGVEGNWRGMYRRLYNTIRPDSHPWEILGYAIRPDWWLTEYVPTSIDPDGTPRYADTHPMWADIQGGLVNGTPLPSQAMEAPIPVDSQGRLIDPVAAGILTEEILNLETLNDDWAYGDGGPTEQAFYDSYYYSFAVALAGYLMKPAVFVERLWSDFYQTIGALGTYKLWRAPHIVYQDTLTRPPVSQVLDHLTMDENGDVVNNPGLNSWISEHVQVNGGSPTTDFSRIVANSAATLGWKVAGYINKNQTVIRMLSSKEIPYEDVNLVVHEAPSVSEKFASGMAIVREDTGYRVFGYNANNPVFRVELAARPTAGGQVELREEFTADEDQHSYTVTEFSLPSPFDTSIFAVIVNGMKIKPQFIHITTNTTFDIDPVVAIAEGDSVVASLVTTMSNPSTQIKSFIAGGIRFNYLDSGTGEFVDFPYGRFFDSATEVVNFMIGHGRYINKEGWVFETMEDGEIVDWLNGAKRFAEWAVTTGRQAGGLGAGIDGLVFYFSPYHPIAKLELPFGHVLPVENIVNGAYGLFDRDGTPIDSRNTFVSRHGGLLQVRETSGLSEIFGVRAYVTEIQHALFFSNITKFNDLIYDPVIALYHSTLFVDTYKAGPWTGRYEAPGFVISADGMLLPNFEKMAYDITRFYDRTNPIEDPLRREQALNLYGYEPKPYMDDLGIDDHRLQFSYYNGMRHAKGTRRPFTAFARATKIGTEGVIVTEEWAWKLGEFGDVRNSIVQIKVNKDDFRDKLQVFRFEDDVPPIVNIVDITAMDREELPHPRWIIPPRESLFGTANLRFPVSSDVPDVENYTFSLKSFEIETSTPILSHFHWDPALGRHEPEALSKIDYISAFDPARYTTGEESVFSGGDQWAEDHVGDLWWDISTRKYMNYRGHAPDYRRVASDWGTLLYFNGDITREDELVTVVTRDPLTGNITPHGLSTGDTVSISGADQDGYNVDDITITVVDSTTFTYDAEIAEVSPATGLIIVQVGSIRVYEWVESPVPPEDWEAFVSEQRGPDALSGTVIDPDNPSYSQITVRNPFGNPINRYYFWVRANRRIIPLKAISAFDVQTRLTNPVLYGLPFFAPITDRHMLVYTDGERFQDGYGLEISYDQRSLPTHIEWHLISEGDEFIHFSEEISSKILDSLCRHDDFRNPVPNEKLAESEKYGNSNFPSQTIYRDVDKARAVFIEVINSILVSVEFQPLDSLIQYLDPADDYWEKATYFIPEVVGKEIYDTVATISERDTRTNLRMYADGDIVKVLQTANTDLWTGDPVATYYRRDQSVWTEVGIDNRTFKIKDSIFEDTTDLRNVFDRYIERSTPFEGNSLIFPLLQEMLRQNPQCDWFFKSSYISVQVRDEFTNSRFVRASEPDAIIANIKDTKAFRTKVRREVVSYSFSTPEDIGVDITEFPVAKVSLLFDRLSCNLIDDGGWDSFAWDDREWDLPIWYYDDLGRQFYKKVGEFTGNSVDTVFSIPVTNGTPLLYGFKTRVYQNNVEIDPDTESITVEITPLVKSVQVELNTALPAQYRFDVYMSQGFYEMRDPVLPLSLQKEYPDLSPTPSSYEHYVARRIAMDASQPCAEMFGCENGGCDDDLGGDSEERLKSDMIDSVFICVKNDWTPLYAGWDTTPWDTTPWDEAPTDIGRRVFVTAIGNQTTIPPGIEIFLTSEDFVKDTTNYVFASSEKSDIDRVYFDNGNGYNLKTRGIHWEYVSGFTHIIEILPVQNQTVIADGLTTSFTFPEIENGIEKVFRNGALQQLNVQYFASDNTITFVQPVPEHIKEYALQTAKIYSPLVATATFDTGLPATTLNKTNLFIFVNDVLKRQSEFDIAGSNVVLDTGANPLDEVLIYGISNDLATADSYFTIAEVTSDGTTNSYPFPNANANNTFVFYDGLYKALGVDYEIPAPGTISLLNVPSNGTLIEIRVMTLDNDGVHTRITTGGDPSETLTNISNSKPHELMVFSNADFLNGYSVIGSPQYTVTNGAADTLTWIGHPPGLLTLNGEPLEMNGDLLFLPTELSIRWLRPVLRITTAIGVAPAAGDVIVVQPKPYIVPGQTVRLVYNRFDLGMRRGYTILDYPAIYDIVDNKMIFPETPINETITVQYNVSRLSPHPLSTLVRMSVVVEDVLTDETLYDSPTGFETSRRAGMRVANSTDFKYYEWTGTGWINVGSIPNGEQFYAKRPQRIYQFNGTAIIVLFNTGDSYPRPPLLGTPLYGRGLTWGTIAYGSASGAATEFPDAYQVVQHPGDIVNV